MRFTPNSFLENLLGKLSSRDSLTFYSLLLSVLDEAAFHSTFHQLSIRHRYPKGSEQSIPLAS